MYISDNDTACVGVATPASQACLEELLQTVPCALHKKIVRGIRNLLRLSTHEANISSALIDYYIIHIDTKISTQVNAILKHSKLRALESAWRNLHFLVNRVDFTQNTIVELLSVSKEDLLRDFQDAPAIFTSGLYHHIYTSEFGQFGGAPVAAMIADYNFTPAPNDIELLRYVSAVASMAHAPFFAAAGKEFFEIDSWNELPDVVDLQSLFEAPRYAKWNSFRDNPNARYIGLTLSGFLLRLPYTESSIKEESTAAHSTAFTFVEELFHEDDFCWGNAAFVFAVLLADSFAKYRWCVNIIGPEGGGCIDNLLCSEHEALYGIQQKIGTRILLTEKREFELATLGFLPLSNHKSMKEAVFFSANSVLRAKKFPDTLEGAENEINFRLSTQFPYMMLMNRLAHYIKVLQRENMGMWLEKNDLSRELNAWVGQYVTAMDTPDIVTRSKRPLRMANVIVNELEGNSGWYAITILVRPHFKYMGVNFTLSLEGKLERKSGAQELKIATY